MLDLSSKKLGGNMSTDFNCERGIVEGNGKTSVPSGTNNSAIVDCLSTAQKTNFVNNLRLMILYFELFRPG